MRTALIVFIALVLALGGALYWWYARQFPAAAPAASTGAQIQTTPASAPTSAPVTYDDLIEVDAPRAGASADDPLHITGKARGPWYFEATFPVKLYDGAGALLASAPARATGEWMTNDYVPFMLDLPFTVPPTATGTLVLANDNPSGNPATAKEVRISLTFTPVVQQKVNSVSYRCSAGKTITADYYQGSAPPVATGQPPIPNGSVVLTLSDGRFLRVPQTLSASGIRYANADESFIFWSKGNTAFVQEGMQETYTNCVER